MTKTAFAMRELSPVFDIRAYEKFAARILTARDACAYKEVRLKALKEEGHLFGPLYSTEKKMTDEQWEQRCSRTEDHCFFGLFERSKLIGILFATRWDKDETGQTALWGSAYVIPEYRGRGLAAPLYKAREEWTARHPRYNRAIFFIKEGNKRSAEIHERRGARHISTEIMKWPGRPPALWRWYEKPLKARTSVNSNVRQIASSCLSLT